MVKQKFQLRVRKPLSVFGKPISEAKAIVQGKKISQKSLQINEAGARCKEHEKRACCFANINIF